MAKPLDRKSLYDLVWSKPMTAAAKEYGLSDRGLAKLCERNSIPVPPRGYWAKKAAGQKVRKAPLIVLDEKEPETAILLRKATPISSSCVPVDIRVAAQVRHPGKAGGLAELVDALIEIAGGLVINGDAICCDDFKHALTGQERVAHGLVHRALRAAFYE